MPSVSIIEAEHQLITVLAGSKHSLMTFGNRNKTQART